MTRLKGISHRHLLAAIIATCVGAAGCTAVVTGDGTTVGQAAQLPSHSSSVVPFCDDACLSSYAQYTATATPLSPGPSTGPTVPYAPTTITKTTAVAGTALKFIDPDTGGSFDITVSQPIAVVLTAGGTQSTMGVRITVSNIKGDPEFAPSHLGIASSDGPLTDADDGEAIGDDDPSTIRINSAACKGERLLYVGLELSGFDDPDSETFDLATSQKRTVTGCVVFDYDSGPRPTALALFDDDPGVNDSANVLLSWSIKTPN